jgi:alkanesulfonate monooxygenase SsuD/methylene tetrahydromethanopterin reductase-like flavin-dependent oxidoreductase (luciferase family)
METALPALRAALDGDVPGAALAPRPVQASVPLWVGGSSPVAVRRAAQHGDGWLPQGVRARDLPEIVTRVRGLRAEAGRPEAFDVGANVGCYVGMATWDVGRFPMGEPEAIAASLRTWTENGANQLQVRFRSRDRTELVDQIERFGAEVAPHLGT